MPFKSIALATVMLAGSGAALANNVVAHVSLTDGTATFAALHTDSLDFTDAFTFDVSGAVMANASLITIGWGGQNIDFTSASLNGQALMLTPNGYVEAAFTPVDIALAGPLVLTVSGKSGAGKGVFASYAGTLNVTAVPEPETYAMMIDGLAAVGFVVRRRRPA